jgi:hypothetical protein
MSQRFNTGTVVTASAFALNPALGYTVCGWIYNVSNSGGDGDLFFASQSANPGVSRAIRIGYASGPALRWRSGDGVNLLNETDEVVNGDWSFMSLTYNGSVARAYLDGIEIASKAMLMSGSNDSVSIGALALGASTVELAQVKVWQGIALTPAQLQQEMLYWRPQTAVAKVYAWWQLEAAAPTLDSSGNLHTLSGPGSANGTFTPPGQLDPVNQNVAAVGGVIANGTAVVRMRQRVQAVGDTISTGRTFIRTTVPSAAGGGDSPTGGRSRLRRQRR